MAEESVVLRDSYAGNMSFAVTGNTVRYGNDGCSRLNSSSASLSIPSGSSVVAAFLYWSGSGNADSQVSFAGTTVTADQLYTANDEGLLYYSAKADVTAIVSSSSRSYTVSGLYFDGSNQYCSGGGAYGGWSLLAIYENTGEPLRVVNIFDGFQIFWGNSITLSPSNFIIADDPSVKGGHHAHITWEGDEGNSYDRNGSSERLMFNGHLLTDLNNPSDNQFNSYSNTAGSTSGVDVDMYDISSYLTAGATSVSTTYSTGQDQVFLTAEVISVPNQPVSDLELSIDGPAAVYRGELATYTFDIHNNGPLDETSGASLTFALDDMDFYSYSGTGWSCSAGSLEVSCSYSAAITDGADASPLVISLASGNNSASSYELSATVTADNFDHHSGNDSASVTTLINNAIYSFSKTAVDLDGGIVRAGDTLRYTISLTNNSGATVTGIEISDELDSLFDSFSVVSVPGGASYNISGQQISVSNISIANNATASIVIDADIRDSAVSGEQAGNIAVADINGSVYVAVAATMTVDAVTVTQGNKPVYLHPDNLADRVAEDSESDYQRVSDNRSYSWTLSPQLATDLQLDTSETVPLTFFARADSRNNRAYDFSIELSNGSDVLASTTLSNTQVSDRNGSPTRLEADLAISGSGLLSAGTSLTLTIRVSTRNHNRDVDFFFSNGSEAARFELTSQTVINVEDVSLYDAAYPDGSLITAAERGQTFYIRAKVSDPFGVDDITSAAISLSDPAGNSILDSVQLTEAGTAGIYKYYEYEYTLAADATSGSWVATIKAEEGYEGEVSSVNSVLIPVLLYPELTLTRSSAVQNDPVNSTENPKAIPGAEVVITLSAINQGEGSADTDSLIIEEILAPETELFIGDFSAGSPVLFEDLNNSGLTFSFISLSSDSDDIDFSSDGDASDGITYGYSPVDENGDGYDPNVTAVRLHPKGTLNSSDGSAHPEFNFRYQVKVQ